MLNEASQVEELMSVIEAQFYMKNIHLGFPTALHQEAAESILTFFNPRPEVDTILLLNSCAREQATPQSDLDIAILLSLDLSHDQVNHLEECWHQFSRSNPTISSFQQSSRFAKVHLDFINGHYSPSVWDDGGGPDDFEIAIGNHVAYSFPLSTLGSRFAQLQSTWLPYYNQELRDERLTMVRDACLYDLEHVPFFVERSLHFQAFDRLYKAFREFLQLLFIKQKQYPIAYNKWIYEQVAVGLGLDELHVQLLTILSIDNFESTALIKKANELHHLVISWS